MSGFDEEALGAIKSILFDEYGLESIADLEDLDPELLAEIQEQLKTVQDDYGLNDDDMENALESLQ